MSEEKKPSSALMLNSQEAIDSILKEVQEEFITSDREVFKAGLRSLMIQEQKLLQQKASIDADIVVLGQARDALTEAFRKGELHSVSDARGVVRTVNSKIARDFNINDDEF